MKKILFFVFALSTVSLFADNGVNIYTKVGVNAYSKYSKVTYDSEENLNFGTKGKVSPTINLEVTKDFNNFEVGAGIGYIKGRGNGKVSYLDDFNPAKLEYTEHKLYRYDSFPLYATVKYNFNVDNEFKPYLKADLGYSFNKKAKAKTVSESPNPEDSGTDKIKVKNGLYYSVGAGVEYNNFLVELSYVNINAKIHDKDDDGENSFDSTKYNNRAVKLSVGYKFGL